MKLLITGDVCFKNQHEVNAESAAKILAPILPFFEAADYRVMNLETPLAEEGVGAPILKSGPNIIGRPRNIGLLTTAHCDCAVLANNHTKDFGEEALYSTFDIVDNAGIARCGAGKDIEEAYRAHRFEKDGIRVSLIAVCENEFGIADFHTSGTAGFDLERLGDKIREEKAVSDFVVVIFHGGCEHNPLPSPLCRERYRTIIRLGADALIGGHTHCIQGYEYYDGKPIVYSMGNFLFKWDKESVPWHYGYMSELTLEKGTAPALRVIPYRQAPDGSSVTPLSGQTLSDMLAYIEKVSAYIGDTEELTRLYQGWCAISGVPYIRSLVAKPEYFDPATPPADIGALKNLLSCEAHNELVRTTLNLAFAGRMGEAYRIAEEVRVLQRLPVGENN